MQDIQSAIAALQHGGVIIYPLLLLALAAMVVVLDKTIVYRPTARAAASAGGNLRLRLGRSRPADQ